MVVTIRDKDHAKELAQEASGLNKNDERFKDIVHALLSQGYGAIARKYKLVSS